MIDSYMTKKERLHNMFAQAVLREIVKLEKQNLNLLDHDTFLSEYVLQSSLDLGLLRFDEEDNLVINEPI
jgi:hypothetical protein